MQAGDVQRITGLNAFGEPFRGRKIGGVKARHGLEGPAAGQPFASRRYNANESAEQAVMDADTRAAEAARQRGEQRAMQGAQMPTPEAPKRQGQLVASTGGGYKWANGDELDQMDRLKADARKKARQTTDYQRRTRPQTYYPAANVA